MLWGIICREPGLGVQDSSPNTSYPLCDHHLNPIILEPHFSHLSVGLMLPNLRALM